MHYFELPFRISKRLGLILLLLNYLLYLFSLQYINNTTNAQMHKPSVCHISIFDHITANDCTHSPNRYLH